MVSAVPQEGLGVEGYAVQTSQPSDLPTVSLGIQNRRSCSRVLHIQRRSICSIVHLSPRLSQEQCTAAGHGHLYDAFGRHPTHMQTWFNLMQASG